LSQPKRKVQAKKGGRGRLHSYKGSGHGAGILKSGLKGVRKERKADLWEEGCRLAQVKTQEKGSHPVGGPNKQQQSLNKEQ